MSHFTDQPKALRRRREGLNLNVRVGAVTLM